MLVSLFLAFKKTTPYSQIILGPEDCFPSRQCLSGPSHDQLRFFPCLRLPARSARGESKVVQGPRVPVQFPATRTLLQSRTGEPPHCRPVTDAHRTGKDQFKNSVVMRHEFQRQLPQADQCPGEIPPTDHPLAFHHSLSLRVSFQIDRTLHPLFRKVFLSHCCGEFAEDTWRVGIVGTKCVTLA